MKLFKFVDSRGVDILKKERIKFTPPQEFKDPFEMQLGITKQAAKKFARQILDEREHQAMQELPGYKNLSHRQRKKGRREMVKTSEMVAIIRESFQKRTTDESTEKLGILSLCESHDSNLMWYHYADGLCAPALLCMASNFAQASMDRSEDRQKLRRGKRQTRFFRSAPSLAKKLPPVARKVYASHGFSFSAPNECRLRFRGIE